MSKKLVKFCRITLFIEQTDKAFADAIDKVCVFGPFSPNSRETGVTFLYPHKALKDEIIKKAFSDKAEDANAIIRSLIISGYFPSASDFTANDYVVNRLSQIVKVSSASGDVVKFADGAEAKLNKSFKGMGVGKDNKMRLAVYDLTKGSFGIKGDHVSTLRDSARSSRSSPTSESKEPSDDSEAKVGKFEGFHDLYGGDNDLPKAPVSGGYDYSSGGFNRLNFWHGTGEAYINKFFQRPYGELKDKFPNPFLEKLVSLLNFMETFHNQQFLNVIDIVDYGPHISLYLLIEPYKKSNFVVGNDILDAWKNAGYPKIPNPFASLVDILTRISVNNKVPLAAANKLRGKLFQPDECIPWRLSGCILAEYKKWPDSPGMTNAHLKSLYKADPLLKIQQDEARFLVQTKFMDLENRRFEEVKLGILNRGELRGLFKNISAAHTLTKPENQLYIGHGQLYDETNIKGVWFDGPFAFLRSTDFLYVAVNMDTMKSLPEVDSTADIPNYKKLINMYDMRMKHTERHHEDRAISAQGLSTQFNALIKHSKISTAELDAMQQSITERRTQLT